MKLRPRKLADHRSQETKSPQARCRHAISPRTVDSSQNYYSPEEQRDRFTGRTICKEKVLRRFVRCPGLVVMSEDSCSRGYGFESLYLTLDGYFFTLFFVKMHCLLEEDRGRGVTIK